MTVLSWRNVDVGAVVLAGLVAGYVMAVAGLWAGSVPGLVGVDIADYGRRYMAADRPAAWLIGLGSHLVNSVLLVLLFACIVEPNLAWPRPLAGVFWGGILAVSLAGALVAPMSGLGFMGYRTGSVRYAATSALLHVIWGVLVGVLYAPR